MGDQAELTDLRRGEPLAWRQLHAHITQAAASFRPTLGDTWEDAVQEAEIKLYRALQAGKFQPGTELLAFVWRLTQNTCIDAVRQQALRRTDPLDDDTEPRAPRTASPFVAATRREIKGQIHWMLAALPEGCQHLLRQLADGLSYSDLAWLYGVSPGTLRVRAHRCRERAREQHALMTTPVISAAQRLFREQGIANCSLHQIARAADLPLDEVTALYRDRLDILWAILDRMITGVQGVSRDNADVLKSILSEPEPEGRIRAAARLTQQMYDRGLADFHVMVYRAAREDPKYQPLVQQTRAAQMAHGQMVGRAILNGARPRGRQTVESRSDSASMIVGPDSYLPKTREQGWSREEFWEWAQVRVVKVFLH